MRVGGLDGVEAQRSDRFGAVAEGDWVLNRMREGNIPKA